MTPPRDLVAERGNGRASNDLRCRACGFAFGRVLSDRRRSDLKPGLHMVVDTTLQRVDIICPKCGQRRSFTNMVICAMTIPKIPA